MEPNPDPTPHFWWWCRPALFVLQDPNSTIDTTYENGVIERVWERMNDDQRHRFHRFSCENDTTDATLQVIDDMREAIRKERGRRWT